MKDLSKYFNKKVIIFCPHQDDEINIAGGIIPILLKNCCDVKIVYSTNGDYFCDKKYRYIESINSLKVLGVPEKKVYFLGYPDCLSNDNTHLYMCNQKWISKNGDKFTSAYKNNDYHYLRYKKHNVINKKNFINDIYDLIKFELPDILICVDFDSHADHRALSLSFENAMGILLRELNDYNPLVLKAFAYPTSYLGYSDFKQYILPETKFNREKFNCFELQNPYYNWDDRVRINSCNPSKRRLLLLNKTFRAIMKHHSQFIVNKTYSIINSDYVYFERFTDNLLLRAKISTSSGISSFLNDFMYFDLSDIMHGNTVEPVFDLGKTIFDDNDLLHEIHIELKYNCNIREIRIFQAVDCNCDIKKISIIVGNDKKEFCVKRENFCYIINNINLCEVNTFIIRIDDFIGSNLSLTEIEAFETVKNKSEYKSVYDNPQNISISILKKILIRFVFLIDDLTIFLCRAINKIIRCFRKKFDKM